MTKRSIASRDVVPSSMTKPSSRRSLHREPRRGAVVHHEAVLAQHQPVARLADGKRGKGVAIDAVKESGSVRALDLDLAGGGEVAHADTVARRRPLSVDGLEPVLLSPARIVLRAQPLAGFDAHRALLARPLMRRDR